jgi:hypothetical protein
MGRPAIHGEAMTMIGLRLPAAVKARLALYAERLAHERPGSAVGVSDAIRALLIEGLDRHRVEPASEFRDTTSNANRGSRAARPSRKASRRP